MSSSVESVFSSKPTTPVANTTTTDQKMQDKDNNEPGRVMTPNPDEHGDPAADKNDAAEGKEEFEDEDEPLPKSLEELGQDLDFDEADHPGLEDVQMLMGSEDAIAPWNSDGMLDVSGPSPLDNDASHDNSAADTHHAAEETPDEGKVTGDAKSSKEDGVLPSEDLEALALLQEMTMHELDAEESKSRSKRKKRVISIPSDDEEDDDGDSSSGRRAPKKPKGKAKARAADVQIERPLWEQPFEELDDKGEEMQASFVKQASAYHALELEGKLIFDDEIAFERLKAAEHNRRCKVSQDRKYMDEIDDDEMNDNNSDVEMVDPEDSSNLFVQDSPPRNTKRKRSIVEISDTESEGSDDLDGIDNSMHGNSYEDLPGSSKAASCQKSSSRRKGKSGGLRDGTPKKNSKAAKLALEATVMAHEEEEEYLAKKKTRKSNTGKKVTGTKAKPKTSAGAKKPRAKARKSAQQGATIEQLQSTDVFNLSNDTFLEDGEVDNRHLMSGNNRNTALKQLVINMPEEQQDLAKVDAKFLDDAASSFTGRGLCKVASDGTWRLKGMQTTLKHFQMCGASWMRQREDQQQSAKGGILADDMGLGKTVMMLSCIVNGMPPPDHQGCKATLVVVPSSLLSQWFEETMKHVHKDHHRGVLVYKANKIKSGNTKAFLSEATIVLTTYHEIVASCPKIKFPKSLSTSDEKKAWFQEHKSELRGVYHQIEWYRVVIDEAHVIKNHRSITSLAVRELMSKRRWAMTGTPLHNDPNELYPYFRFLNLDHTACYKMFLNNFNKNTTGRQRLAVILNKFMMRRTYADKLFGEALVKLPRTSLTVAWVKLNPLEREVYELVEKRIKERVQTMVNSSKQNFSCIFTMFLRLRQLTSHMVLIEEVMRDVLTEGDINKLKALAKGEDGTMQDIQRRNSLVALRKSLKQYEKWRAATDELGDAVITYSQDLMDEYNTGHSFAVVARYEGFIEGLKGQKRFEELKDVQKCAFCDAENPTNPHLTSCAHLYCYGCVYALMTSAAMLGGRGTCSSCNEHFDSVTPWKSSAEETPPEGRSGRGKKSKGKKKTASEKARAKDFREKTKPIYDTDAQIPPSPKTAAVKTQVLNWIEENPQTKIIVFTQFVGMIKILKKLCQEEGWACLTFFGGMTLDERDHAVKGFKRVVDGPVIMLCSLRCGGVGLNLTMAQKVILLDPWWNNAVELQAFGRVFRIGQDQKTSLCRIFARDTIDRRIFDMQERKTERIDSVMKGKKGKMDAKELMELFGEVEADGNGGFIFSKTDGEQKLAIFDDDVYKDWEDE